MFSKKTVFVVGAGASAEFGLPLGNQLKSIIADKVNIGFEDGYRQSSGDPIIRELVEKSVPRDQSNSYYLSGRNLAKAMPQAISIDNYLHTHAGDSLAVFMGRAGIAASIMESEAGSLLQEARGRRTILDFNRLEDNWLSVIMKMLCEGVEQRNVENLFRNFSIITFNYDRCIEFYLAHAISNYFNIDFEVSTMISNELEIFHPYGAIGALEWQNQEVINPFGTMPTARNLTAISDKIRTFSERIDDDGSLDKMRSCLSEADQIIYLGFSFGNINMQLLTIPKSSQKEVFATAYKISPANAKSTTMMIRKSFGDSVNMPIAIESMTCTEFLAAHWNPIMYS